MASRLLSELIREGAQLRPQGFGDYFFGPGWDFSDDEVRSEDRFTATNTGATCAIGAALDAAGYVIEGEIIRPAYLMLDEVFGDDLIDTIAGFNDNDHKTREEIADWLAESGRDVAVPVRP